MSGSVRSATTEHPSEASGLRTALATVCLSGTLEDKLAAAAAAGLRRRRDLRAGPGRVAARPRPRSGPAAPTWASRSTSTSPSATSTRPTRERLRARTCGAPSASSTSWSELGTDLILVCSSVSPDAVDDDGSLAEQLHAPGRAGRRRTGCASPTRRSPGARHVNTYEQSWDDRAAGRPPRARPVPGQLPHPVPRLRPGGHRATSRREAVLPAARRRPAHEHGRAAVEPPPPALPRPGRLRPARLPGPRAGRGLHRAAVARGVQRRLPPVRPAPRRGRRPPVAAGAARGDSPLERGRVRRPPRSCTGSRSPRSPSTPTSGAAVAELLAALGFATPARHRSKPVQLWQQGDARVLLNRARPATARRSRRSAIETADPTAAAGRAHGAARAAAARSTTARPRPTCSASPRPDGTAVFFCHTAAEGVSWLADFLPTARRAPATESVTRVDHVALTQPFDNFDEAALFYRSLLGLLTRARVRDRRSVRPGAQPGGRATAA